VGANTNRWPNWSQWRKLPLFLTPKERYLIWAALFIIVFSAVSLFISDRVFNYTETSDFGGSYSEALIGQPRFINPILSEANDVDRDLSSIIYSGLMKYTSEGILEPDLAERYEISRDGLVYTFWLKDNIRWHNDKPLKVDDVIFTVNSIQNPDYESPLRINWQNVLVEKLDDRSLRFILDQPYAPFLESTTLGILPFHIWSNVSVRNFPLAEPNLTPIGTGPYIFRKLVKDKTGFIRSIELITNNNYHRKKPFIDKITFKFYETENEAIAAWNNGEVMGLSFFSLKNQKFLKNQEEAMFHRVLLPRFFAIFFNQSQHKALADKNVRLALQLATNKKEIIKKATNQNALIVSSPIFGLEINNKASPFNIVSAKEILDEANWLDKDGDGIREKQIDSGGEPTRLSFNLAVPSTEELKTAAEIIKNQWSKIGVEINLEIINVSDIQNTSIKPRNYQILLFGEVLGIIPDLYVFWHSSQKRDPGVNLALYDNKDVDKLIEEARRTNNQGVREQLISQIETSITDDIPAIFLYNPYYVYLVNKEIKGISLKFIPSSAKRFTDLENWYTKTKRVRK